MTFLLLIGGIFFCAAGFYWNSKLLKRESEHRNARGVLQFNHYHGQELHENQKALAGVFRTVGLLLVIVAVILIIAPFFKQG